jgi:hypothetical protein
MAYNRFKKVAQLRELLGLEDLMEAWLPVNLPHVTASGNLLEALRDASEEALGTEKAKSEYVIVPVLKELKKQNPNKFTSFSGYHFDVDSKLHLTGYCDFILSAHPKKVEIDAPVFCLVEAKKGEVEEGFAQCGAEMYAAQLFNERHNNPQKVIYGCVTSAFSWAFLKLEEKTLCIDPNYVPLTFVEPERVLAVLQWILDESLAAS